MCVSLCLYLCLYLYLRLYLCQCQCLCMYPSQVPVSVPIISLSLSLYLYLYLSLSMSHRPRSRPRPRYNSALRSIASTPSVPNSSMPPLYSSSEHLLTSRRISLTSASDNAAAARIDSHSLSCLFTLLCNGASRRQGYMARTLEDVTRGTPVMRAAGTDEVARAVR